MYVWGGGGMSGFWEKGLCLGGGMGYNEGEENLRANHSGQKKKEIGLCSLIEYGFSQI